MHFDLNSNFGDIRRFPECKKILDDALRDMYYGIGFEQEDESMRRATEAMTNDLPLRAIVSFTDSPKLTREFMQSIIDRCNAVLEADSE